FAAGFFTHRAMSVKRIQRVAQLRSSAGFEDNLFRIIQPSEEQRAQLSPIVQRYAGQIADNNQESRRRQKELVDSMHLEIKPLLTEKQLEQLDRFSRRFRDYKNHRRKKDGKKSHPREKNEE
nr:hypothetical protein [Saprospiraceae bacterium]